MYERKAHHWSGHKLSQGSPNPMGSLYLVWGWSMLEIRTKCEAANAGGDPLVELVERRVGASTLSGLFCR